MSVSSERIADIEVRLTTLEARTAGPREARIPVTVAHRCRRARKALRGMAAALRRGDLERVSRLADDAEREVDLAEELVRELAESAG